MLRLMLRGVWITAASAAIGLVAVKLALFVAVDPSATRIAITTGVVALLYALFLLEGLQVAALQLRESALSETLRYIDALALPPKTRASLSTFATLFEQRFDAFVTGRQILVITTVVSMAALLRATTIRADAAAATVGPRLQVATDALMPLINAPLFAFVAATLVPAWISQLLPQFLADRRAFPFLKLPLSLPTVRFANSLDTIGAGAPARFVMGLLQKAGYFAGLTVIPMSRSAFFDKARQFYGRSRREYRVAVQLGNPTRISETLVHEFARGSARDIYHPLAVTAPLTGQVSVVAVKGADGRAAGAVAVIEGHRPGSHIVRIPFDGELRQADKSAHVEVSLAYAVDFDTSTPLDVGFLRLTTAMPLERAEVALTPSSGIAIEEAVLEVLDPESGSAFVINDAQLALDHQVSSIGAATVLTVPYPLSGLEYRLKVRTTRQVAVPSTSPVPTSDTK